MLSSQNDRHSRQCRVVAVNCSSPEAPSRRTQTGDTPQSYFRRLRGHRLVWLSTIHKQSGRHAPALRAAEGGYDTGMSHRLRLCVGDCITWLSRLLRAIRKG